jgi:peptide chain release factor subunit 3
MTEEDKIVAAKGKNVEATTKTEATTESQPEKKKTAAKKSEKTEKAEKKEKKEKIPETDAPDPDSRSHINVVFIGHVDAGKSTISGQILYLTGQVDQRTIEKFEKEAKERNRESWFMAYIMDTNEEERAKGKTVEVGMAHFASDKKRFTILDAPGHKNYVPNMIGGAAQADIGVLVISARKGEFEAGFDQGGQTREHAMLAYTLGVQKLIILINKMDCCDWDEKRYTQIKKKLAPFLRSCGYKVKRDCVWICGSGLHGLNLSKPLDPKMAPWIKDRRCLLQVMDDIELAYRDPEGPVRLPILEKFSDRGTWIMGKVEQGTIRMGQKYIIMPNGTETKVADLTIKEETVAFAKPGENVRIKLSNTSEDMVAKGFVLSSISQPIPVVRRFRGILQVIELLEHRPIISPGYKCMLHVHTSTEECVIAKLLSGVDRKTGKPDGKRCKFLKTGTIAYVEIRLKRSVSVHTFEQMKQLGRFTLRDEQLSIAIGKITALAERTVKKT